MATTNTYTNAKAVLRGNTTVYTAPSAGTSIIKSIRVSNNDTAKDIIDAENKNGTGKTRGKKFTTTTGATATGEKMINIE